MKSSKMTEVVTVSMKPGYSTETIIEMFQDLESKFHKHLDGYIDSELSTDGKGQWLLVMHWESRDKLSAASKAMMESPKTEQFRDIINPTTVKIGIYHFLESWTK